MIINFKAVVNDIKLQRTPDCIFNTNERKIEHFDSTQKQTCYSFVNAIDILFIKRYTKNKFASLFVNFILILPTLFLVSVISTQRCKWCRVYNFGKTSNYDLNFLKTKCFKKH